MLSTLKYQSDMSRILLESVATYTYCIFFTVYSIGAIKITKTAHAIFDSFFKWLTALSEMHQVRGWVCGRWGVGAEQFMQIKSGKQHFELVR